MIKNYLTLLKLRVVELLIVTTIPAMFLAAKGFPDLKIALATVIGGTLAAGSANAFNMAIESDRDRLMTRTASRPTAQQVISKKNSYIFATVVGIISLAIFQIFTNTLATLLTLFAIVFYVIGYTIILKPNTSQNIVWGGIAGCMPVLIGWATIENKISLTAILFFLVVFFWTPPHFWALAIKHKSDYAAADFPMLPIVAKPKSVVFQLWFHSIGMTIVSLLLIFEAQLPTWCAVATLILVLVWKKDLLNVSKELDTTMASKLFQSSIVFLSVYSLILVIGALQITNG